MHPNRFLSEAFNQQTLVALHLIDRKRLVFLKEILSKKYQLFPLSTNKNSLDKIPRRNLVSNRNN